MDNWKYGDFRKGKVSEVEITPIVRNGKAKFGKNKFDIGRKLIKLFNRNFFIIDINCFIVKFS